jgi:hypothetical protein
VPALGPAARSSTGLGCGSVATPPGYRHAVLILMENQSYGGIIGSAAAPYINLVASACGSAGNYHGITHDSLPNYLALTGGAPVAGLRPFDEDCAPGPSCQLETENLFHQVASSGGWRAYEESMPSACDRRDSGSYAVKHNPAVYYADLAPGCTANDVSLGSTLDSVLLKDFSDETHAPAFAFVTPDLCDDMHGGNGCSGDLVKAGDDWLRRWLPLLTASAVYKANDTAILVAWDEGAGGSAGENCAAAPGDESCHVPLLVIAPSVPPGTLVDVRLDHYSLLKTVEDVLGVPELGAAAGATGMMRDFNLVPRPGQ